MPTYHATYTDRIRQEVAQTRVVTTGQIARMLPPPVELECSGYCLIYRIME